MDLESLKERWQRHGAPEPHWTTGEDMHQLRTKLAKLRRTAARRDLREAVAAIVVAAIFGWMAFVAARPLARVGAAIVAAGAIFIIIWMRAAGGRNREPDVDLPVVEFFRLELRYLDRQYRLLRSVAWWYIAPNLVGVILFFLGGRSSIVPMLGFVTVAVLVAAGVYWLNQVAARDVILPLRDEVARLLRDLETETS
jgi:hypothetical protein